MIWLAPRPPLSPPTPVNELDRRHTGSLRKREKRDNWLVGQGGGVGEEPNHNRTRKPCLYNHSILSDLQDPRSVFNIVLKEKLIKPLQFFYTTYILQKY